MGFDTVEINLVREKSVLKKNWVRTTKISIKELVQSGDNTKTKEI